MSAGKVYRAIGLMSGTSLDGIDAALIETDGYGYVKPLDFLSVEYSDADREVFRSVLGRSKYDDEVRIAEELLTRLHIDVLRLFGHDADVIGFHGQTLFHDPDGKVNGQKRTFQIGDGAKIVREIGVKTVCDFRSNDVANGGQGAPFLPLYHQALFDGSAENYPVAILNIGGVSNITFLGDNGQILAFDCGAGNALLDDFVFSRTGKKFDDNGNLAKNSHFNSEVLERLMAHKFFDLPAPKSLDRDAWDVSNVEALSDGAGAATLTEFTAVSVQKALDILPEKPLKFYVCGGGRHNAFLMDRLRAKLGVPVVPVEALSWNGDAIEAEGFAYLAVRSMLGEVLSLPTTTGVAIAQKGGVLHKA